MMKKYPSILRVLVALAMVFALVGVIVAPASAQSVNTVTPSPATVSELATYTVNITTTKALSAGDTIDLDFPDSVTIPSTISRSFVSVDGYTLTLDDPQPIVDVANAKIIIQVPPSLVPLGPKTFNVVISQGASLRNPGIAKFTTDSSPYEMKVTTTGVGGEDLGKLAYRINPSYKISPTTGGRTTTVTVTGKGWTPNGGITICPPRALPGYKPALITTVGTVLADGTFSVTAQPNQDGFVTLEDSQGRTENTWGLTAPAFTLTARVSVSPTSGNVGSKVTISGYDFSSPIGGPPCGATSIKANGIKIGGVVWGPATAITLTTKDGYGQCDDFETDLNVLYTLKGGQTIEVTDNMGKTAKATFTVNTPYIVFEPASAAPNAVVTAKGYNFGVNDTIPVNGIMIGGNAWGPTVVITVDAAGQWTVGLKVPATAQLGDNPVTVTTAQGTAISATFTVGARALTLSPTQGPYGTKVILGGSNMTPSGQILQNQLTFDGTGWNTSFAIGLDSQGNIITPSQTLKVTKALTTSYGAKTVQATDNCGGLFGCTPIVAKATFTLKQPTLTISPTKGYMGDTITITGTGWLVGSDGVVQVLFDGDTRLVTTPDSNGAFAVNITVPGELAAETSHLIGANDFQGNSAPSQVFLLNPATLVLNPVKGPVGTSITVTAKGFTPRDSITNFGWGVDTNGNPPSAPAGTPPTDSIGTVTLTITVPGLAIGGHVIGVKTSTNNPATATFEITTAPPTVQEALKSLVDKGELIIVWDYAGGQWKFYDPADPQGSDLLYLVDGTGYWIDMKAADKLIFGGKSRDLPAGWSIMAW